jgi:hypothetical protein
MVKGDLSNVTEVVSYFDGSEPWETSARAYESGADQQTPPPSRSPRAPEAGTQGPEGGQESAIAWPLHVGPTHTPIVCRIAEEETQFFGCDLNSKFSFINTVKNLQ